VQQNHLQTTLLQNQTAKYTNQAKIFHPTQICRTHYNFHLKSTENLLKIQNSRKQPKIELISLYLDQKNHRKSLTKQPTLSPHLFHSGAGKIPHKIKPKPNINYYQKKDP
jgi:hypothetical protein